MEAAIFFLKENQHYLADELKQVKVNDKFIPENGGDTEDVLFNFVIEVASGELTLEECQAWFKENIEAI